MLSLPDTEEESLPPARTAQGDRHRKGVLVLLFLLVAGGLYYAYSQMQQKALRTESLQIVTAQITQFPAAVRAGVARLQAGGVPLEKISFAPDAAGSRAVFHKAGGGVRYQMPPSGLLHENGRWRFKTVTASGEGWFIAGAGSDGPQGKDVFAYLSGIPPELCAQVNRALGLPAQPRVQAVAVDFAMSGKRDARAGWNPWTFSAHAAPDGETAPAAAPAAACIRNGADGAYVYYHLLAAQ